VENYIPAELIKKKRRGSNHSREELAYIVNEFTAQRLPDYQMSAWLMAVCFQGMSEKETSDFTALMRDSGQVLNFKNTHPLVIDKHSTGGVGDKTSLIVGPLAAAAGVHVAMVAGRGLGHTGGTLDKLESIPGLSVQMSLSDFQRNVVENGIAIIGQTADLCPADKFIYALRDVTGTVDSLPLICSSIMSKKLAEGLGGLVLDVKFGSGAFMKSFEQALVLAKSLQNIGKHNGLPVTALLTNMDQPLGQFVGNALEVGECLQILKGELSPSFADTRELSIDLASHMIYLGKKASSVAEGRTLATKLLQTGQAFEVFSALCKRQGASSLNNLPRAKKIFDLHSEAEGYIVGFDTEMIGVASIILGAGRTSAKDQIDPASGIECLVKIGSKVNKGDLQFRVHGNDSHRINEAMNRIRTAIRYSSAPPAPTPLVAKILF
jgi:pyrimidine-nucleoside phosphorylase